LFKDTSTLNTTAPIISAVSELVHIL